MKKTKGNKHQKFEVKNMEIKQKIQKLNEDSESDGMIELNDREDNTQLNTHILAQNLDRSIVEDKKNNSITFDQ